MLQEYQPVRYEHIIGEVRCVLWATELPELKTEMCRMYEILFMFVVW
jgi:hypothetical protein